MNLTAWRISHKDYASVAFNGEGTYKRGGRWNKKERYIVYTSDSLALASREYLAGIPLADLIIPLLVYLKVEIDERLIETIDEGQLPSNWKATRRPKACQTIGNTWYDTDRSLVLRVPSAVIPVGFNYLINRKHPDFSKLVISDACPFTYDKRTEEMLAKAMIEEVLEREKIIKVRKRK